MINYFGRLIHPNIFGLKVWTKTFFTSYYIDFAPIQIISSILFFSIFVIFTLFRPLPPLPELTIEHHLEECQILFVLRINILPLKLRSYHWLLHQTLTVVKNSLKANLIIHEINFNFEFQIETSKITTTISIKQKN